MFTGLKPATLGRRFTALASAMTLVALLSGNVAAYQLVGDDGGSSASSPCYVAPAVEIDQLLRAKLATTSGCNVIANG